MGRGLIIIMATQIYEASSSLPNLAAPHAAQQNVEGEGSSAPGLTLRAVQEASNALVTE